MDPDATYDMAFDESADAEDRSDAAGYLLDWLESGNCRPSQVLGRGLHVSTLYRRLERIMLNGAE